ncbi:MAG: cytidylyltransferase domain-containing protein [Candidatus Cloacimonadia bacterium]
MLAIIPARGGSKGLPNKNIKPLAGKPLIAYTIESALSSSKVDRLIVSTDDEKIAEVAVNYGAEIPFMRPSELAQDSSKAIDVYIYTLKRLNSLGPIQYDDFLVLQPTSPLRTSSDIDSGVEIFYTKEADSVISVTKAPHPPIWAKKIDENGTLSEYFNIDTSTKNRQDFEQAYIPNGAVFILKLSLIEKSRTYYFNKTYAYEMPMERSVDIDNQIDFELADFLINRREKK